LKSASPSRVQGSSEEWPVLSSPINTASNKIVGKLAALQICTMWDYSVVKGIIWTLLKGTKVERYVGGPSRTYNSCQAPSKTLKLQLSGREIFSPLVEEYFTQFTQLKLAC